MAMRVMTKQVRTWTETMVNIINDRDTLLVTLLILAVIMFTGLATAGLFARPIADDLSYYDTFTSHDGVIEATTSHYLSHNGRLSQAALAYSLYGIFGIGATRMAPLILLSLLSLSFICLYATLLPPKTKMKSLYYIALGALTASAILLSAPSLFDNLYWLTASTVYIPALANLIFVSSLAMAMVKYPKWRRLSRIGLLSPVIIVAQLFGESGAVTAIAITGLLVVLSFFYKPLAKRGVRGSAVLLFALLVCGLAVNLLSPGTKSRQDSISLSQSFADFIVNIVTPIQTFLGYFEMWHIALAGFIGLSLAVAFGAYRHARIKTICAHMTLAILLLVSLSLATFVVSAYSVGPYMSLRNLLVPHALIMGVIIAAFFYMTNVVKKIIDTRKIAAPLITIGSLLVLLFGFLSSALYKQVSYTQALAIRDTFYSQREMTAKHQAQLNQTPTLTALPPLIIRTEATDLRPPGQLQVDWFVQSINSHYSIDHSNILASPREYCLSNGYTSYELSCRVPFSTP